jgi:uncharacterized protein (TIGR03663 family)
MKPPDSASSARWRSWVLIFAVTILAAVLRVPRLQQRPMHGDEAVHADKFRLLLEEGFYRYDPIEYHGPTLNYLTLIPAWLSSAKKLTDVTEFTLRIVPVLFGVLLVLLCLLILDGLGLSAGVCAAVLTAISPAMVYYSRYYIHEMLLVCFSFAVIVCGYRYVRSKNITWALLAGAFVGLMHATKETCIIALGSMFLALMLTFRLRRPRRSSISNVVKAVRPQHLVAAIVAAAVISALFYSSFFTNAAGIADSFRTYGTYFGRAANNELHIHPWYYYLKMLIYSRYAAGPVWSEAIIVVLAGVGFVAVVTRKGLENVADSGLLVFIAFYTLIMTAVYSAVPYKTPWCMLGFLHGMILLAAVGAVALTRLVPSVLPRLTVVVLLVAASAHLAWQAYQSSYKFYADSRNPYVYAHPTTEVFAIAERVEQYARVHEDGHNMPIQVICPDDDYWPLPWYLRRFANVGWYSKVPDDLGPLIIASPAVETELTNKLYVETPRSERQMYFYLFDKPYYVWLRPKIKLLGFVRKDLWESCHKGPDPAEVIDRSRRK